MFCNTTYKSFDNLKIEARKAQIESMFRLGITGQDFPKAMAEKLKQHEANIKSLEGTLGQFDDAPSNGRFARRMKDRIDEEKLWIKHYTFLQGKHKEGRERLTKLMTGLDMKIVVDHIIKDEKINNKKKDKEDLNDLDDTKRKFKQFVPEVERFEERRRSRKRRFSWVNPRNWVIARPRPGSEYFN